MSALLRNATPWLAEAIPFVDDSGAEGQLVVLKLQYEIGVGGALHWMESTEPLSHGDRFDEDFAAEGALKDMAPLLSPADVMDPQPSTNVLVSGHVHAPQLDGARHFEPWIGVGTAVFPMRVHAPRSWRSRWFITRLLTLFMARRFKKSREGMVTRLPLRWQHAYGGIDKFRGQAATQFWPFNPAGAGFHADQRGATVKALPLPAIEDPRQPIGRWQDQRLPQLPAALNSRWAPRAGHGGTRDAHWQATRAPAMPRDGSALFHNTAHPSLQFTPHLCGGEAVCAQGFSRDGQPLSFELPRLGLSLHSYHYGGFTAHALPLNTVLIDTDQRRLTLLYRSFVPARLAGNDLRRLMLGSEAWPADLRP